MNKNIIITLIIMTLTIATCYGQKTLKIEDVKKQTWIIDSVKYRLVPIYELDYSYKISIKEKSARFTIDSLIFEIDTLYKAIELVKKELTYRNLRDTAQSKAYYTLKNLYTLNESILNSYNKNIKLVLGAGFNIEYSLSEKELSNFQSNFSFGLVFKSKYLSKLNIGMGLNSKIYFGASQLFIF